MVQPAGPEAERVNAISRAAVQARPHLIAALTASFRDIQLAEDAFSEALVRALDHFRDKPPPRNVMAWLYVTARRWALDQRNTAQRRASLLARYGGDLEPQGEDEAMAMELSDEPIPDERLRLIFICCHPALADKVRVALALRSILGVSPRRIAEALLQKEATLAQRLSRARMKIRTAGIAFETPAPEHWADRLQAVLATLELAYALAYGDAGHEQTQSALGPEVLRLSYMLAELLPDHAEVWGLLALIQFAESRSAARIDDAGRMIPLSKQDSALWDRALIDSGFDSLGKAAALRDIGPLQLMAAIHASHARRAFGAAIDWHAILRSYDGLVGMRPGLMVAINRAYVLAMCAGGACKGAEAGLAALDDLADEWGQPFIAGHRGYLSVRAALLDMAGETALAKAAYRRAIAATAQSAERRFLIHKCEQLEG